MAENVLPNDGKTDKELDGRSTGQNTSDTSAGAKSRPTGVGQNAPSQTDPLPANDDAASSSKVGRQDVNVDGKTRERGQKGLPNEELKAPESWFPQKSESPPASKSPGEVGGIWGSSEDRKIRDWQFQRAHHRLVDLASFAGQLSKPLSGMAAIASRLGPLNTLKFTNSPTGRDASDSEWRAVEERTQEIWSVLTDVDRRRFNSTQVPGSFTTLVLIFLGCAIMSVGMAYWNVATKESTPPVLLWAFLAFVVASGAMGAAASIGMNALSVQDDATFDLSVRKFLWLRVSLGALFGTLLTLPWAFPVFQVFVQDLGKMAKTATSIQAAQLQQAAWLLAPFVLGFSTSLVILVLTRMVEAIQTIFGKSATK